MTFELRSDGTILWINYRYGVFLYPSHLTVVVFFYSKLILSKSIGDFPITAGETIATRTLLNWIDIGLPQHDM